MFGRRKSIMNVRAVHALPCFAPTLWFMVGQLNCKEIKPVNPKGNQPWIFLGRTDAEAAAPVFAHLMLRDNSLEKTLMLGKIEGKKRKVVEDEMVR